MRGCQLGSRAALWPVSARLTHASQPTPACGSHSALMSQVETCRHRHAGLTSARGYCLPLASQTLNMACTCLPMLGCSATNDHKSNTRSWDVKGTAFKVQGGRHNAEQG